VSAPIRRTIRWATSLFAIGWGLIYLNSAVASAWVASGPPNKYPELWVRQSYWHLGYATACFAVAAAVIWIFRARGYFGTAV
jgi:hypothetical protein